MIKLTKKINVSWILVCSIFAFLICIVVWINDRDYSKIAPYLPFVLALFAIDIFRRNSVIRIKRMLDFSLVLVVIFAIYQFGNLQLLAAILLPSPARYVKRALTTQEIAKPSGRYATFGYMPDGNALVHLNSPVNVPKLEWSKSYEYNDFFASNHMLVDAEGNTWYPVRRKDRKQYGAMLHCVKPDGTMKWERDFQGYRFFQPHFACEKAVVCSGTANKPSGFDSISAIIECVNLDGKTIWRTNPIQEDEIGWVNRVSRFSENRLGIMRHVPEGMMYSYFDLSDGHQIDEKFYERLLAVFPCEMPGGKIAGLTERIASENPGFGLFNSDGSVAWKFELPTKQHSALSILTSDNNLLVGTHEHLGKIDPDGNMVWYKVSIGSSFDPVGILPNNNYLVYNRKKKDALTTMYAYDPDGKEVWSYDDQLIPNHRGGVVFIYQDGNILFGHKRGISLMSPDGEIIWNINPEEPNPVEFKVWNIFPAPGDRIVAACGIKKSETDSVIKLYSFDNTD